MLLKTKICLLFIICAITLSAQDPYYKTHTITNGFICSLVNDVYQSKNGFIWSATDVGLAVFDGFEVTPIVNTYPWSKAVIKVFEDHEGTIWCQSESGLMYFVRGDSLVLDTKIAPSKKNYPAQLLNDYIITLSTNGVNLFNIKTRESIPVAIKNVTAFTVSTKNEEIYLFTTNSCITINTKGKIPKTKIFSTPNINTLPFLFNNTLYTISNKWPLVIKSDNASKTLHQISDKHLLIKCVKQINNNLLALCTTNGLYFLNKNLDVVNKDGYFKNSTISGIIKDYQDNFWLSTINNGLIFTSQFKITSFCNEYNFGNISRGENAIYVGTTDNKIYNYNIKNNKLQLVYSSPFKYKITNLLYNNSQKQLLFFNNQLNILNSNNSLKRINLQVNAIDTLTDKNYVIAHKNGLSIYTNNTTEFLCNWKYSKLDSLQNILTLSQTSQPFFLVHCVNNKIYTTNTAGLFEYSTSEIKQINYGNTPLHVNNLGSINNQLVVITYNVGVLIYQNGKLLPLFNASNGMAKSDLYLGKTLENMLYLLQYDGMQKYNPITKEVFSINMSDGVESDLEDFTAINDTLYASNFNGFLRFKLDDSFISKTKPHIVLNSFYVNDELQKTTTPKTFNYTQNNIKINYSLIDYRGKKYTKMYFKINNGAWQEMDLKSKNLFLSALEPNSYQLQLKAISYRGVTSNIINIQFSIKPPFYKTAWFVILTIVLISTIIVIIAKNRIKNLQKNQLQALEKQQLQHEINISTLKSIRAQMNPHFLYNSLNAIQSLIYTNDKNSAAKSLGQFSDLSRMILECSNKEVISLNDEIKLLTNYLELEKLRIPKISYAFNLQANLPLYDIEIPTMILQPIIENAITHGLAHKNGNGHIDISISTENDMLAINVTDDGIGRKKAKLLNEKLLRKSAQFSTNANLNRIEIINSYNQNKIQLHIDDKIDVHGNCIGTSVLIKVPLFQND